MNIWRCDFAFPNSPPQSTFLLSGHRINLILGAFGGSEARPHLIFDAANPFSARLVSLPELAGDGSGAGCDVRVRIGVTFGRDV